MEIQRKIYKYFVNVRIFREIREHVRYVRLHFVQSTKLFVMQNHELVLYFKQTKKCVINICKFFSVHYHHLAYFIEMVCDKEIKRGKYAIINNTKNSQISLCLILFNSIYILPSHLLSGYGCEVFLCFVFAMASLSSNTCTTAKNPRKQIENKSRPITSIWKHRKMIKYTYVYI